MKTLTEDNKECCYALQDKVWIEDPDGNAWEVFVVKADAAVRSDGKSAKTTGSGGCCGPSKGNVQP